MGQQTRDDIIEQARARKERILAFMTQDPPVPLKNIAKIEGMHERACRVVVKEIEAETGVDYMGNGSKAQMGTLPYGLTSATGRLRQKLGDYVYLVRERGNDSNPLGRNQIAPRIGLNNRQQLAAESKPFSHDWTLSQIERLAREVGEQPVEFLLKCLTT